MNIYDNISPNLFKNETFHAKVVEKIQKQTQYGVCALHFWVTKASETHSEYVILMALQRCLHERATMLRHSYIAFLVYACCTERLCRKQGSRR
jgi:hypothetical protein